MIEIRYGSLSSPRDVLRLAIFWSTFGILGGSVVGFLLGARSGDDFRKSVLAGLLFASTLGVAIVAAQWVRPRWIPQEPAAADRVRLADVGLRLAVTLLAAFAGALLVDALVFPGFLRNPRTMGSILIYMIAGAALFMAIDYAARFQRIYRARVRSEEQYKARVEEEMRTAAAIQHALLPRPLQGDGPLLIAGRTIPSRTIAGDFFDHFEIGEGSLAFVIGDVAGKGPPAAILAAVIQGMVATLVSAGGTPRTILERLNQALLRRMAESRFATLVLGIVDPAGRMTLANAGHPRAVLVRGDGSTARLERGGFLLGVFGQPQLEDEVVQLAPRDSVVLFSDGVSEARNGSGEEFGEARVLAAAAAARELRPERALEALLDEVWRFKGGTPPEDDVTVLVLRYHSNSPERPDGGRGD